MAAADSLGPAIAAPGSALVMTANQPLGSVAWVDLTVESAAAVRDFYQSVVLWSAADFDMGGYSDYCMNRPADGATVAGICHARGVNSDLPPCWLVYLLVRDLDESMRRCVELGGRIHTHVRDNGEMGRFCVIQDPAGAYVALLEPPGPRP